MWERGRTFLSGGVRAYSLQFEVDINSLILPGYSTVQIVARQRLGKSLTASGTVLLAGTEGGVFRSTDRALTRIAHAPQPSDNFVTSLTITSTTLSAGTRHAGVWQYPSPEPGGGSSEPPAATLRKAVAFSRGSELTEERPYRPASARAATPSLSGASDSPASRPWRGRPRSAGSPR